MNNYYRDGNALMDVILKKEMTIPPTRSAIKEIYRIVGKDRGCFAGSAYQANERGIHYT